MNLRRRHKIVPEVSTASLNDIMFFLMLFFLIASTVVNPNVIKLLLPKASSGQSVAKKTISVSITKDLQYFVEKQNVPADQIEQVLQSFLSKADELTVILYVDKTVQIQDIVNVMDISNRLKVKLVLATDPK
ncbi:MAG: ExbD/TolR family protein [bacterium]|jgi:biopolymer transport protein ExbD